VDLVQTGLFWNGGRCVFVERAPVAPEVELLMNVNVLILEDLRRVVRCDVNACGCHITYIRHRAPRPGATWGTGAILSDDIRLRSEF
jgi:hypothetical protein